VVPRRIGIRTIAAIRINNLNLCDIEGILRIMEQLSCPDLKEIQNQKNAEGLRDIIKPLDRLPVFLINVFHNIVNKNNAKCSTLS
jgi:hypothetical protein